MHIKMFANYADFNNFFKWASYTMIVMNKGKILVLASTFPRWNNDATPRFVYDLSDRLASQYGIIVLAPHHNKAKKKEIMGKIDVRRFSYFKPESMQRLCYEGGMIPNMKKSFLALIQLPLFIISEFFSSYNLIKKENISMIHAHWILPQGFVAVILKKIFGVPLLVTIHGSDLFPLKNIIFRSLQEFVLKNADFVTVNSAAAKSELSQRFPGYSTKIKVIPMGVDTRLFTKRSLQKPKKYAKNKIILFVGRLSDQKGVQYLVDSMQYVTKSDSDAKLLIIGSGPYESTLIQKTKKIGMWDYVEFLGPKSSKEIAGYYNFCDVFVLPSLSNNTGTESLGLSLLEAMASGCAVIGTKVGGIPNVISNNHNGLIIGHKDALGLSKAMISILEDRKKAVKLGNNAEKFVKARYSWEPITWEFIKIYENILK